VLHELMEIARRS